MSIQMFISFVIHPERSIGRWRIPKSIWLEGIRHTFDLDHRRRRIKVIRHSVNTSQNLTLSILVQILFGGILPGRHKDENREPTDEHGHGLSVYGCPLGDEKYTKHFLKRKLQLVRHRITHTANELAQTETQTLWAFVYYCFTQDAQYWAQNLPPSLTKDFLREFDDLVLDTVARCFDTTRETLVNCKFSMKRLRLPVKMGGAGVREMCDVAPAAFLGAFAKSMRRMTDETLLGGAVARGFLHDHLHALFAPLDECNRVKKDEQGDLESLSRRGNHLPMVQEAEAAHKQIYDELKEALDEGLYGPNVTHTPLPPTMTGKGLTTTVKSLIGAAPTERGIQHTITNYRETPRHLRLLRTARAELEHHRKSQPQGTRKILEYQAFLQVQGEQGMIARQWLNCWGDGPNRIAPQEFQHIAQWYLVIPDPGLDNLRLTFPRRDKERSSESVTFPPYRLTASEQGKREVNQHHNTIVRACADLCDLAIVAVTVEDRQVLTTPIDARAVSMLERAKQPDAPREAKAFARTYHQAHVRPDLNIGDHKSLYDVKTFHGSMAAYAKEHTAGITAVEAKAAKVPDEYLQKIRARDELTHPSAHRTPHNNDIGPLETKFILEQMSVTGLAFGMYGETSRSVLDLVAVLASPSIQQRDHAGHYQDNHAATEPAPLTTKQVRPPAIDSLPLDIGRGYPIMTGSPRGFTSAGTLCFLLRLADTMAMTLADKHTRAHMQAQPTPNPVRSPRQVAPAPAPPSSVQRPSCPPPLLYTPST